MATQQNGNGRPRKRGLASADEETRKRVAQAGGKAVSQNREHMASIGRKGGQAVSQNRAHMADIGRMGGKASHARDADREQEADENADLF